MKRKAPTSPSPQRERIYSQLPLPGHYALLLRKYTAVDAAICLLASQKVTSTYEAVKKVGDSAAGESLTLEDIARMKTIFPEFLYITLKKYTHTSATSTVNSNSNNNNNNSSSNSNYHHHHALILDIHRGINKSVKGKLTTEHSSQELALRSRQFRRRLVDRVLRAYRSEGFPDPFAADALDEEASWDPSFDLSKVADIDMADLPVVKREPEGDGARGGTARDIWKLYRPADANYDYRKVSVAEILAYLSNHAFYDKQMVCVREIPGRAAVFGTLKTPLCRELVQALQTQGISRLYSHQVQAINAIAEGKNVVIAASTSSGKSLIYNIPALQTLNENHEARSLYIFPTKALTQDQLRALVDLFPYADITFGLYDGDTEKRQRHTLRNESRIVLTNPDMLSLGILPHHQKWAKLLKNLKFVVLDELHTYRGIFGSHVACVLRRLRRVCTHYGAAPQYILCSATIANPLQHAQTLTGLPMTLISQDGSATGKRTIVLWNPPLITPAAAATVLREVEDKINGDGKCEGDEHNSSKKKVKRDAATDDGDDGDSNNNDFDAMIARTSESNERKRKKEEEDREEEQHRQAAGGERRSVLLEATHIFVELVKHSYRTLTFAKTRNVTEIVLSYAYDRLRKEKPELVPLVKSYRAGYVSEERRDIEKKLFKGDLMGVVTTSALELGVDIGSLDATVAIGYAGSIASTWQQIGRAGRGDRESISFVVAYNSPLDQYIMRHPNHIFDQPHESCIIDEQNEYVLEKHLACAAYELPLSIQDVAVFGPKVLPLVQGLVKSATLKVAAGNMFLYAPDDYPAANFGLRSAANERYVVKSEETGEIIEDIEASWGLLRIYPGAIFLNKGETYKVVKLDLDEKIAVASLVKVNYYTKVRDMTEVLPINVWESKPLASANQGSNPNANNNNNNNNSNNSSVSRVSYGQVNAKLAVLGYWKVYELSEVHFDKVDLDLPPTCFDTTGLWLEVAPETRSSIIVGNPGIDFVNGIHAVGHALSAVLPLHVITEPYDVTVACVCSEYVEKHKKSDRLIIHDNVKGGIGISKKFYDVFDTLLAAARAALTDCACPNGCPSCLHSSRCTFYNEYLDKAAAIAILAKLCSA